MGLAGEMEYRIHAFKPGRVDFSAPQIDLHRTAPRPRLRGAEHGNDIAAPVRKLPAKMAADIARRPGDQGAK